MNDNTVVLITGCSSGIGFSTAIEFAKNGFVTYPTMRDLIKKNKLAEQLTNPENILELDVTNDASIDNTISQIENKHGKIDILVNNSGFGLFGSFEDTSIEEFKQQMETNFFGSIRLMKKTIPLMKKNKSGKIINISSVGGISGFPFMSSHISSAFALEGLTESLRFELKKFGIQLSLIEMGGVNTKFFDNKILTKEALSNPDYSKSMTNYLGMIKNISENSISPDTIAKKIIEVSNLEILSPRYLVGDDAQQITNQKNLLSPLEYEKHILNFMLNGIID